METNYNRALQLVLKHEGGFVNLKADPGGPTNKGITLQTFRDFVKPNGTVEDLKRITDAEVATVYRKNYWQAVGADKLAPGVDFATFDAAVNSGPGRAKQWLLKAVGSSDHAETVRRLCATRLAFMRGLKTWGTFGKGWSRRVAEVEATGVAWAKTFAGQPTTPAAVAKGEAQKAETSAKTNATASGGAAAGTAAGGGAVTQLDPSTFDWTAWLFVGGLSAAGIALAVFFFIRWRRSRERADAFTAAAQEIGQ